MSVRSLGKYVLTTKNRVQRFISRFMPYEPMRGGRERLNEEYSRGDWDYLGGFAELPRFSVIAGYCRYLRPRGTVLEVGCGSGTLQEHLDRSSYATYIGLDISDEAIKRALLKQDSKTQFVQADADVYVPDMKFDIIIFNECLEYFEDPLSTVTRYEAFLNVGGYFIVSMFHGLNTARTERIWHRLDSRYVPSTVASVTTREHYRWNLKVYNPGQQGPT